MASTLQSPGIQIVEKDVSGSTPGLSTTVGGTVGVFQWGPVMNPMLIDSEASLVSTFGKPDQYTFGSFFGASNFLTYANALWVTRAETGNLNGTLSGTAKLIKNIDSYDALVMDSASGAFAARYPGLVGNSIIVSYADSSTFASWEYASEFQAAPGTSTYASTKGGSNDELHIIVIDRDGKFSGVAGSVLEKFAFLSKASDALSYQGLSNYYPNVIRNQSSYVYWMAHPVVGWGVDAAMTAFPSLAKATTTVTWAANVATATFGVGTAPKVGSKVVIKGVTPLAYNGTHTVVSSTTTQVTFSLPLGSTPGDASVQGVIGEAGGVFTGGTDDNQPTNAELQLGWDLYKNVDTYDISLAFAGNADTALSKYIIDNIGETRRDCVVFVSIATSAGGPIFSTSSTRTVDAATFKTAMGDSTYAVIDSGYKYLYDKYNDKYRWVALNSDVAGLCAKVDRQQDTWFSPAGVTKGQIKGVIKLSWNPTQAERDVLYKLSINPVSSFIGLGTMLYGDKTATSKPSSFDRINVRRLFLNLEKSISNSAKYQLFEINDSITRQQFIASVEPFLRDVQGRRGISAFRVICDETNNTAQVVQTNQFVGTILVKANYSVNFLTLNFVAVGQSVTFEVAGQA